MVDDAFFVPLGDGAFRATEHTSGPWAAEHQHGGPPSALLTRAIEATDVGWPGTVTRVVVDILGPVPVADLTVSAQVLRGGRSVALVAAELAVGGRTAMRAQGWVLRREETAVASTPAPAPPPLPEPADDARPWTGGYLRAVEWRWTAGHFLEPGPATVWTRLRVPLVRDEVPSGLQRVMAVADSGNGVSNLLDMREWLFINPDLTVHVQRPPRGEWICLDAATSVTAVGFGLATSVLHDLDGPVARGAQTLRVALRG